MNAADLAVIDATFGAIPGPWATHAAYDPDLFHPVDTTGPTVDHPITICRTCPVQTDCLTFALDTHQHHGIWGGTTEAQRARMRKAAHLPRRNNPPPDVTTGHRPSITEVDVNRSARQTAEALGITPRTVQRHRAQQRKATTP